MEFGRLFDAYARSLHRYLARRVGQETAHDLVSETFLVALNIPTGTVMEYTSVTTAVVPAMGVRP